MSYRLTITISLLAILMSSFVVAGAPEFAVSSGESSVINPDDTEINVQNVTAENFNQPVRIKELTIINFGTASESELESIQIEYENSTGDRSSTRLNDLTGISSGITFSLPAKGVMLDTGSDSQFRFNVDVLGPSKIPVSKYGEPVSVELGVMFHYVYLNEEGDAIDSVSSTWYRDTQPDVIERGGFENTASQSLGAEILNPGCTSVIGQFTFVDEDLNDANVIVKTIEVVNDLKVNNPLVLGQDIVELVLEVEIDNGETVKTRSIRRKVTGPTSKVVFNLFQESWWNGECSDDSKLNITVKGKVAVDEKLRGGLRLRTGLKLNTKEGNGMEGFPFLRHVKSPADSVMTVEPHGLEYLEETTVWRSKVVNKGETYVQRLSLGDDDADPSDFVITEMKLLNEGSLDNEEFSEISLYRVLEDGELVKIGSDLKPGGRWQNLESGSGARVPDQGEALLEVHYTVSPDATSGSTFSPAVQFRGNEGSARQVPSPLHRSELTLTVRPNGAEIASSSRQLEGLPALRNDGRVLAQRIDVMDKDENRFDLFINPIVVKNLGTATAGDFERMEIFDSNGNLLIAKTDLSGLDTAGVTFSNLDGKTVVRDNQYGNWRSFYIYLVPSARLRTNDEKTVQLETTLYQTEGKRDFYDQVTGPRFTLKSTGSFFRLVSPSQTEATTTTSAEEVSRQRAPLNPVDGGLPLSVGGGVGVSYSDSLAVDARVFGQYYFDMESGTAEPISEGGPFNRVGVEMDSIDDTWYFSPYATLGYEWITSSDITQYAGGGAGVAFLNTPSGDSAAISIHGTYGVKLFELFEGEAPIFTQGRVKYLFNPVGKTVFEVDIGVIYA